MNIAQNIITQALPSISAGKPQGFNLGDETFAKLLEKHLSALSEPEQVDIVSKLGIPPWMEVEPIEQADLSKIDNNPLNPISGVQELPSEDEEFDNLEFLKAPKPVMRDLNIRDYFSAFINNASGTNSMILNYARRHASDAYNVFGKNLVENIKDFVSDASSLAR